MAILIFEGQQAKIPDGEKVLKHAETLGMPFGCCDGLCGTCRCTVVVGHEHLPPKNEKEEEMDLDDNERLTCQITITGGTVELKLD